MFSVVLPDFPESSRSARITGMDFLAFNIGDAFNAPIREGDPGPIAANLVRVAFVISGIFVIFMFVFAGFGLIRGAGNQYILLGYKIYRVSYGK
jgi:hypothetical protein